MISALKPEKIEALLQSQIFGRLGCHANDITYIVPISYAYDEGIIYCHSNEGQKIDLMRLNPKVCFQVDNLDDMASWKSVLAWGDFEELKSSEEKDNAYRILMSRHFPIQSSVTTHLGNAWPFSDEGAGYTEGIFFRIVLHTKTGRFEKKTLSPNIPG